MLFFLVLHCFDITIGAKRVICVCVCGRVCERERELVCYENK